MSQRLVQVPFQCLLQMNQNGDSDKSASDYEAFFSQLNTTSVQSYEDFRCSLPSLDSAARPHGDVEHVPEVSVQHEAQAINGFNSLFNPSIASQVGALPRQARPILWEAFETTF